MAFDSLAVGLGVGLSILVLLIIALIILYVFCWRNERRLSREKRIQRRPTRSYQTPGWVLQPSTHQPVPVTQTSPEVGWYNYNNQYGTAPDYGSGQSPWPQQTLWYATPYGAAGATGDQGSTKDIRPGTPPSSSHRTVSLSVADVDLPAKGGFLLPKLPKPEPFILPTTKTDLEVSKDEFGKFILPTDREAIIDEFGSDRFILPTIGWKTDEDTVTGTKKTLEEGPIANIDAMPAYGPYAPPPSYYPAYDPYSSYQPYKPIPKPNPEQPKQPPAEAHIPASDQQATQPDQANQVYYHVTEKTVSPSTQQQQQQPADVDKPAKVPEVFYYMTADATGAPVPTPSAAVPATTTTSYAGYAVRRETSCVSSPEQPGQMTCTSTKNVYRLEPVPDATKPNQLMWIAEQSTQ